MNRKTGINTNPQRQSSLQLTAVSLISAVFNNRTISKFIRQKNRQKRNKDKEVRYARRTKIKFNKFAN